MKKTSTILFTAILGLFLNSCNVENNSDLNSVISDPKEFTEQYVKMFNKHDATALASYWTEDAVYSNPVTGVSISGRKAIADEFKKWFEQGKVDKLEAQAFTIHMIPEEDMAIAKGVFRLTFKDGREPYQNAYHAVLVKENGKWLIDHISQVDMNIPKSNFNQLKDLTWLIGDWIDKDENSTVETKTEWDKYKNFITQNYVINIYDQQALNVRQIIGWDPVAKQIRSWLFDSDGGFGEGKWYNKGDSWFVDSVYTLADGRRATAVNIYTPIDKDSYSWSSEGRDIDGVILPNIEPIKIVRTGSQGVK